MQKTKKFSELPIGTMFEVWADHYDLSDYPILVVAVKDSEYGAVELADGKKVWGMGFCVGRHDEVFTDEEIHKTYCST